MTPFIGCVYLYSIDETYWKYTVLDINTVNNRDTVVYLMHYYNSGETTIITTDFPLSTWNYEVLTPYQELFIENNPI